MTLLGGQSLDTDEAAALAEEEELDLASPDMRAAGRWNSAGVPRERSPDFRHALRRLAEMIGPLWGVLVVVVLVAVASAVLNVLGPRVLGHATDIIITGEFVHHQIDFEALHRTLFEAIALYA